MHALIDIYGPWAHTPTTSQAVHGTTTEVGQADLALSNAFQCYTGSLSLGEALHWWACMGIVWAMCPAELLKPSAARAVRLPRKDPPRTLLKVSVAPGGMVKAQHAQARFVR